MGDPVPGTNWRKPTVHHDIRPMGTISKMATTTSQSAFQRRGSRMLVQHVAPFASWVYTTILRTVFGSPIGAAALMTHLGTMRPSVPRAGILKSRAVPLEHAAAWCAGKVVPSPSCLFQAYIAPTTAPQRSPSDSFPCMAPSSPWTHPACNSEGLVCGENFPHREAQSGLENSLTCQLN